MKPKVSKPLLTVGTILCGTILSYLTIKKPIVDDGIVGKSTHYSLEHRQWDGPGWYGGFYFRNQSDWQMNISQEGGFYRDWKGPGWYSGVWFQTEDQYNSYLSRQGIK